MEQQENLGTVVPGEELPPGQQETVSETPNTENTEVETRARAMGWRPQDEFNGDPSKWRSAEEFVQRGENDLPVLRENLRRMTSQVTDLQSRLSRQDQDHKATVQRIEKMSDTALQRQRDQLESSYANAMRTAAANGDIEQYQRLENGKAAAITEFDQQVSEVRAPVKTQPEPPAQNPDYKSKVDAWTQRNPWFNTDPEMFHAATAHSKFLAQMNPGITLDDNLSQTETYMRKRYADKFSSGGGGPAPVEGGRSRAPLSSARGKGWNELPADAQAQGRKFIRDGLFKDEADYAKEYHSQ
jgi:hypothetical protein